MRLTGFTRFLRSSHPTCSNLRHVHPRAFSSTSPSPAETEIPDFGEYSIILPPEPFQFGTSRFRTLPVPDSITLPPYALERERRRTTGESDAEISGAGDLDPYSKDGDGRIELGSDEEKRVRAAGALAKKVRAFAGTLVKVRSFRDCNFMLPFTNIVFYLFTGWGNDRRDRHGYSRLYHRTPSVPVSTALLGLPPLQLYEREQHHSAWYTRRVSSLLLFSSPNLSISKL